MYEFMSREYMKKHYTSSVKWNHLDSGLIRLDFTNYVTDEDFSRTYKTVAAAKSAETRFHNKVSRMA